MRTEQLLREALDDLADTARTPEVALPRILPSRATRPARPRRRALVITLAAVLLIAAVAVPGLVRRGTAEPADTRTYGNWNLVHRVGVPPGWELTQRTVSADSESSTYQDSVSASGWACTVEVLGAGRSLSPAIYAGPELLEVNGHPAAYGVPRDGRGGRVDWQYADDSQASVSCELHTGAVSPGGKYSDPQPFELDFARRVVFEPTEIRLPFRLTELPAGYQIQDVQSGPVVGVELTGRPRDDTHPLIGISVTPGTTEVQPGLPGQETTTVDGRPAVLNATAGSLCLNVRGYTACLVTGGDAVNSTAPRWPAGHRELLLEVAEHLELVKHLDDPTSWPDAKEALPR